jgi:ArsR family transcriptional regulator
MEITEVFKALGDPARLRIVEMLAEGGEQCVCRIVEDLGMSQPVVSHHLAKLRYAGLIRAKKRGQWVDYSLDMDVLDGGLLAFVQQLVDKARSEKPAEPKCPPKCEPALR